MPSNHKEIPEEKGYYKCNSIGQYEALESVKDWANRLLTIEMAGLGGIAFYLRDSNTVENLELFQKFFLGATAAFFIGSIVYGTILLNQIPGAHQRLPRRDEDGDIFTIKNEPDHASIDEISYHFKAYFFMGLAFLLFFIIARIY